MIQFVLGAILGGGVVFVIMAVVSMAEQKDKRAF